ncbi:MAG TPA: HlyD family efflux transporter periplasmic adaptor subunit [Gemmatales bacterium]|nr:HlyD family efflux transporter periplasmic adaptor subunit [Gemmatales bacterium]HMP60802.1 HlyD family efflux transporter periplasmic adaptor subunit [Gemmatales bacterium]
MPATRSLTPLVSIVTPSQTAAPPAASLTGRPRSPRSTWRRGLWIVTLVPVVWVAACTWPPTSRPPAVTQAVVEPLEWSTAIAGYWECTRSVPVFSLVEETPVAVTEVVEVGQLVAKGDVVAQLDPADLAKHVAAQEAKMRQAELQARTARDELETQRTKASQTLAQAQQALELAQLDRDKYVHGDYLVEVDGLKWAIAVATRELEETQQRLEHYRQFVKKGFGTPEQLRRKEIEISRAQYNLLQQKARLVVLEKYTRRRTESDLNVKVEQAQREIPRLKSASAAAIAKAESDLLTAEQAWRGEQARLERLRVRLARPVLTAPEPGIWMPATGAEPVVGRIHDPRQWVVKAKVPEGRARRLRVGQAVRLGIDDEPTFAASATIRQVQRANAEPQAISDVGEAVLTLLVTGQVPDTLLPGQLIEAKLTARTRPLTTVPAQAIVQEQGQSFVVVVGGPAPERRWVELGERTPERVEVRSGLRQGEPILVDAQSTP